MSGTLPDPMQAVFDYIEAHGCHSKKSEIILKIIPDEKCCRLAQYLSHLVPNNAASSSSMK